MTRRASRRPVSRRRSQRLFFECLESRRLLTAELEPNDSLEAATGFVSPADTLTGQLEHVRDVDCFSVALASGATLKVRFTDNDDEAPGFFPTLEIVSVAGVVKASSPDGHTMAFTATTPGTYALRLTAWSAFGLVTGSYSVQATVSEFSGTTESESNETAAAADAVSVDANFRGALADAADVDYYTFSASQGQAVGIKFAEAPGLAPAVRLYSPTGALLSASQTGVGLHAVLAETGNYAFSITSDHGGGVVTGEYVGQLLLVTEPTEDAERGDAFEAATWLDLGPHVVPSQYLATDASFASHGLTGSYVDRSLRGTSGQTDWRVTETLAGTRLDPVIHFPRDGWGTRAAVSLTHGSDNNWDDYSVQWDGYLRIATEGTRVYTASDDGSRLWIDINGDGVFEASGAEFVNNHWGSGQGNTLGSPSVPLAVGDYRIRIQYEEGGGGNQAYLLWTDAAHAAGAIWGGSHQDGLGSLSSLADVDVYAVDLAGTGLYEFRLDATAGGVATQSRRVTLYNQLGQPLDYSTAGGVTTLGYNGYNARPEVTARYYVTVQATNETGLGPYALVARVSSEFPAYRDIPLFYQNYSGYSKPEQVPEFMAFFESRYDPYQVDLTQADPGTGTERLAWTYTDEAGGCGGSMGGGFGTRRPNGNGSGSCNADWNRLADVWFGLFYHENGHGIGLFHARSPVDVMSYGGQYDYFPVGSSNWIGGVGFNGDARTSVSRLQNTRNYMDWVLEAGRIVLEDESNGTLATAQQLEPYFNDMAWDTDPRNDQVVVVGALPTPADADVYRVTAAAGETYSFDVDAAEFQFPLDAQLEVLDASGTLLAASQGGLDRDTGLASVDPFLVFQFAAAGEYYVRLRSELGTVGNYRLKLTPERAFDRDGPRVAASWPDGGAVTDGTRQLVFWLNDQLDPATLTAGNILVQGQTVGLRAGTAVFDPINSTLTWRADSVLPADVYTVTLRGGAGGITDLRGNPLDGETDGSFQWPEVSGNGTAGGDWTLNLTITGADTTPAAVSSASSWRHAHGRTAFDIYFTDELDIREVYAQPFTLRGAGPDRAFATADDTFSPTDVVYEPIGNTSNHLLRVYSRGVLPPDTYRIEASLRDAAGQAVALARTFAWPITVPADALFTTADQTSGGLQGTYINQSLRGYAAQDDWRVTQSVAGTRVDPLIGFYSDGWGVRSQVGITDGSDSNWDDFSVQWDGFLEVPEDGVRLYTRSDDGSRMWIDINGDGLFNSSGAELVNNNWGWGQGATTGPASAPLAAGTYRVRLQYEEGGGGNQMQLMWDYAGALSTLDGFYSTPKVVDVNVQPNTTLSVSPGRIDVTFSEALDPATLTTATFRVRYSPDPSFFDSNDSFAAESDGTIAWNAALRQASFVPAAALQNGYYLLELAGGPGGIASVTGQLLDGEYRDANIAGDTPFYGWNDAPSGDGVAGGDYRALLVAYTSANTAPLAVTPASAVLNSDHRTVTLAVLGSDDGPESVLTYTWSATSLPAGAAAPTFSANGTNAAKNASATLTQAGDYTFTVTMTDVYGLATTGSVSLTVGQTVTSLTVLPASAAVNVNASQQFTAAGIDQFGQATRTAPECTWSVTAGTISGSGLFTAPAAPGGVTVTAVHGGLEATATVLVCVNGLWINPAGGSWSATANWQSGGMADAAGSTADFGTLDITADRTVTLDGARTVGQLVFGDATPSHNWTLNTGSGGPLTLAAAAGQPSLTVNNQTAAINAVLAGSTGLSKAGPGRLVLAGANNYTGTTLVTAGALNMQNANALGGTAHGTTVSAGAALQIQGGITTAAEPLTLAGTGVAADGALRNISGTNTYAGPLTLAAAARLQADAGTLTLSGGLPLAPRQQVTFGGPGNITVTTGLIQGDSSTSVVKDGAGVLYLQSGSNTGFEGTLYVNAGTARLYDGGWYNGFTQNGTVVVAQGATLITDGVPYGAYGNNTTKVAGTLTVNNRNAMFPNLEFTGATVNGSTALQLGGYWGAGSRLTTRASSTTTTIASSGFRLRATGTFDIERGTAATDLLIATAISQEASGYGVTKIGAGTLAVSAASTYSGPTTINAGTLLVTNTTGSGTGTGTVTVGGNGTLGGTGILGGAATVNGTLSPGVNGIGTLSVTNTLAFTSTATAAMDINKTGTALSGDRLQGVSTLTYGGTLRVTSSGDPLAAGDSLTLFSATAYAGSFASYSLPALPAGLRWDLSNLTVDGSIRVVNLPPLVANPASATLSADGLTANLAVLGDDDGGEASLTYTWSASALPPGAAPPDFSTNGTNPAKQTTATFHRAGVYGFTVTIVDAAGAAASSNVNLTVEQIVTGIVVSPAAVALTAGGTQPFSAIAADQFGAVFDVPPTFHWSTTVGVITASGLLTAPAADASGIVTAAAGTASGTSSVTVDATPPTVAAGGLSPAAGAAGVALDIPLAITFNELIRPGSGSILLKNSSDGSTVETIDVTSAAVTVAGARGTIVLTARLAPLTSYYVEVPAGTFQDLAGNAHAGISGVATWGFTSEPLRVAGVVATSSGFEATLNAPLDARALNVYDSANRALGEADVTLVGHTGGEVCGSVTLSGDGRRLAFLRSGNPLAADTYTLTLRSAADGFLDLNGRLLDGDGDGTPGGNHQASFTVATAQAEATVVSLPDFARGAGQAVHVPAQATGLPLRISNAAGVTSLAVEIQYDDRLLDVSGGTPAAGLPADWSVVVDTSTAGVAKVTASGATPLSGATLEIVRLTATVPNNAPYGASQAIRLENVSVNGGAIAALGDVAVHKAAYLGDADGSGVHSAADAFLAVQAGLGLASGFAAHAWTDPRIVGDADGSGVLSAADAFLIVQEGLGLDEPFVPNNPHITVSPVGGGVDPQFRIDADIPAIAGGWVTVPVMLDIEPAATNVGGIDFDLFFDPAALTIDVSAGVLFGADTRSGWGVSATLVGAGQLRVGLVGAGGAPLAPGLREIVQLRFHVAASLRDAPSVDAMIAGLGEAGLRRDPLAERAVTLDIEPVDPRAGGYVWTAVDGGVALAPLQAERTAEGGGSRGELHDRVFRGLEAGLSWLEETLPDLV